MSVLVFAESSDGKFKKSTHEAVYYAASIAKKLGTQTVAVAIGPLSDDASSLGKYGADKVLRVSDERLKYFYSKAYTKIMAEAAAAENSTVIVMTHSSTGKALSPRLSVRLHAGLVAGAIDLPETGDAFTVKKSVFSGKGYAYFTITSDKKVISLNANSIPVVEGDGSAAVSDLTVDLTDADFDVKVIKQEKMTGGRAPLPEAELVVSAGRGLKGPENWGMVEDLADELGATTACSRPVADTGWRPHHEHVGQTGVAIKPNLYIAIGISGAIQHLAGVNQSKTIVVINKDSEAPFFKAADYGIVGDAFEVVPKLTEALKAYKAANN